MSFPVTYHSAMTEVANLAMNREEPGYVRVRALIKLVSELSPLNERHHEVKRELNIKEAEVIVQIDREAEARAYFAGFEAAIAEFQINEKCECVCSCTASKALAEEEEPADEDDDPL